MCNWTIGLMLLTFLAINAKADSVFRCKMNARASRDFAQALVDKPGWCGGALSCTDEIPFGIATYKKPNFDDISYRELLISLPAKHASVSIKSFWSKGEDGKPLSEEYKAEIVGRDGGVVFFIFRNPAGSKLHSYALDLKRKRMVASAVENGITSLGASAKTFDCE